MTPPATETSESPPAELFQDEVAQLRSASAWARFIAVAGFIVAGVFGLALGLIGAANDQLGITSKVILTWVVSIVLIAATAHQLLGYSREVRSFVAHDEPALTRAFRCLRRVVGLMCLYLLLTVGGEVLGMLGGW
jgi:Na+/melibiose symporter-like transporter